MHRLFHSLSRSLTISNPAYFLEHPVQDLRDIFLMYSTIWLRSLTLALTMLACAVCASQHGPAGKVFHPVKQDRSLGTRTNHLIQPAVKREAKFDNPDRAKGIIRQKKREDVRLCPGDLHACALPSGAFECRESAAQHQCIGPQY